MRPGLLLLPLACAPLLYSQLPAQDDLMDVVQPQTAVASPDARRIYAISPTSQSILVVDTETHRFIANIRTDGTNPPGLWPTRAAISPDGSRLYTANYLNKTVSVIDTAANRAVAAITLESWPRDIAVTADGRLIAVVMRTNRVAVIDAQSLAVVRSIALRPNDQAYTVAAVPNSAEVCAAVYMDHSDPAANTCIYCIDAASGVIIDRFDLNRPTTDHPRLMVLRDGNTLLLPSGVNPSSPVPGVTLPTSLYVIRRSERRVVQDVEVMAVETNLRLAPDERTAIYLNNQDAFLLDLGARVSVSGAFDWSSPDAEHGVIDRDHLKDIAVLPDGRVFILCENPSAFFLADMKTRKVTGSFPIRTSTLSVWDGLLSPDGKTFYATSSYADGTALGSVFLVDTASRKVVGETIPEFFPNIFALDPRSGRIYVTSTSSLLALSPESGRIERQIQPDKTLGYYGAAISPDEKRAYLAVWNDHFVVALDLDSGRMLGKIDVGWNPQNVAVTSDGATVVVSRQINTHDDGGLTFLDAATLTVIGKLDPPVAWGARGRIDILTFSPDRKVLYWGGGNYIHVVDPLKRTVIASIDFNTIAFHPPRTPHHPTSMAFSPDGRTAYVACGDSASVAIVDLTRNVVTGFLYSVGREPAAIAISPGGDLLYITCKDGVVVLDIAARKRIALIPLVSGVALSKAGIVDAADMRNGPVSPGEILAFFGRGLGPPDLRVSTPVEGRFPASLDGVSVAIDGLPAPVLYASSGQVAAVTPFTCCTGAFSQVEIAYGGVHTSIVMPAAPVHPAVFTLDGSGTGQAAALNQDGSYNGPESPARAGEIVTLFATGLGTADSPAADGQLAASPLAAPSRLVRVDFGGRGGEVIYAGAAPGQVMGLWQINARIPAGLKGDVPISVLLGDPAVARSREVTVRVRQ